MKISWDEYNRAFVELEREDYRSLAWRNENVSSLPHISSSSWSDYYDEYLDSCSKISRNFIISNILGILN